MSLATLLTAVWFILVGITWLAWIAVDAKVLGLLAFILGLVWLIEGIHPITIWRR